MVLLILPFASCTFLWFENVSDELVILIGKEGLFWDYRRNVFKLNFEWSLQQGEE